METRIPQPKSLKPPSRVNNAVLKTTSALKGLPVIPENKTDFSSAHSSNSSSTSSSSKYTLRRRSKSVTDLRTITSKPTITSVSKTVKSTSATGTSRVAQKRGTERSDEVVKPKVAKMKIPDWDYKSRFQDLQRKYVLLQEELKRNKDKLADLNGLEELRENLQQDNSRLQNQLESLEIKYQAVHKKNEDLTIENHKVKEQLLKRTDEFNILKQKHDMVVEENVKNFRERNQLEEDCSKIKLELELFKQTCNNLQQTTEKLKRSIEDHENLRRNLHNTIQDLKGNIRVFCRVRPPLKYIEDDKELCSVNFPDENTLEIRKSRESVSSISGKFMDLKQEFNFDKVFRPETSQSEVFEELSQLVQSALDGYNVCVFAYGQTGSGKTYTMQGPKDDYGMIPKTIDLIFEKIEELQSSGWLYSVSASFLEIYNENVKDLLDPNSSCNHEVRYNEGNGVTVTNLKIKPIKSANEFRQLMTEALQHRAVATTDFNLHSSRSHAVTKIELKGQNNCSKLKFCGSINLVDLAGSESAKTSAAERLTETKNINKSLSALGSVMLALHKKDSHVPYRNSKLTFLLQSCLGGNSKTLMFVNISPLEECYAESINSLRFASKVKEVKTQAKKNKNYLPLVPL